MAERESEANNQGLLRLHVSRHGPRYVIAVSGELDLSTVEAVDTELRRAESSDAQRIILDLSALTFMDSSGPNLLLRAQARSRADSNRLKLVSGPPRIQRVFELTKTDTILPFLD